MTPILHVSFSEELGAYGVFDTQGTLYGAFWTHKSACKYMKDILSPHGEGWDNVGALNRECDMWE